MPDRGAIDVVEEHLAAFNAHDTERLLAGFADDAVWITGADTVRGRQALTDVFDSWLWSLDPVLTVESMVGDDGRVAAELVEELTIDGDRKRISIAAFFVIADGVITSAKVYREGSADVSTRP